MVDRCESPDSILAIFKEKSQAFDEFRHGDLKLIKLLASIVNRLHAISTSAAISTGASLISLIQYYPITNVLQLFPLGVPLCKTYIFWNWRPPLCACYSCPLQLTRNTNRLIFKLYNISKMATYRRL